MPWGRLDDSLYDHPKLDVLPSAETAVAQVPAEGLVRLAAIGLWTRAISWCNRFLTDGHVPKSRVEKLDGSPELANLLVSAGLFEPVPQGYQIHDFLEFNDSREHILERRAIEAKRKAEWRAKKASSAVPASVPAGQETLPEDVDNSRPGGTDSGTPNGASPNVPPAVPPSVPAGQGGDERVMSRDSPRARPRASRSANPDPSRPVPSESSKRAPTAGARARGAAAPVESEPTDPEPVAVTLTKAQFEAWSSFGPEWDGFKAAWLAKGLRLPPAGDPDGGDETQRGLLWQILDARPTDMVDWVREAPGGSARKVIDHVLARWHEARTEAGADETSDWFGPERGEATEALGSILARVGGER